MSEPEHYTPADHPLARIHALQLEAYFRREKVLIVCPLCKQHLYEYQHKPTLAKCFFLCSACAWFHARPVLFMVLEKAERPVSNGAPATAINAALDKVCRNVLPDRKYRHFNYQNLSGEKRRVR